MPINNIPQSSPEASTKGKCIIIGAGDLTITQIEREAQDIVIAVDGGLSYCNILNLEPDYLLGDFDSISPQERDILEQLKQEIPERVIELKPEKDDTDMLAALRFALAKGYRHFHLYAATGGRLDHTIANIQCLLYLKNNDAVGYIFDADGMIFVIQNEEICFNPGLQGVISLFTLGQTASGLTLTGLKYPLTDYQMTNDYPIGISNEFTGQPAAITLKSGQLLCILTYQQSS